MNANLNNNQNYITCPECNTIFKSRLITTKTHKCICCYHEFESSNKINPNKINSKYTNQARATNNIADKLPIAIETNKSNSDKYIRYYKLKSNLLLLLWFVVPFIIVAMLYNSIYSYKESFAQDYKWREYITKFCSVFNCSIPIFSNKDYIIIEDNAMIATNTSEKIQVYAMLNNIGKYNQNFPSLDIKFKDINGKIVNHKIVSSDSYLENNKNNLLLKNSKQYINILLDDPGPKATSYELQLANK